jgi:hypothetical protein
MTYLAALYNYIIILGILGTCIRLSVKAIKIMLGQKPGGGGFLMSGTFGNTGDKS